MEAVWLQSLLVSNASFKCPFSCDDQHGRVGWAQLDLWATQQMANTSRPPAWYLPRDHMPLPSAPEQAYPPFSSYRFTALGEFSTTKGATSLQMEKRLEAKKIKDHSVLRK